MILAVFTEVLGRGGIQTMSRHAAAVLEMCAAERGQECRLLSLNDPSGWHRIVFEGRDILVEGFARDRQRLIRSVASLARRTRWAYLGHPNLAPLGLLLRLLRPGARYAVATYGIDAWERLPWLTRCGLRAANVVTAISAHTSERMIVAQGIDPRKVRLIPPCLDPAFLRGVRALDGVEAAEPGGSLLFTVARLAASEQYKGIDTVIRALPSVAEAVPDVQYVIVGDGDDRPRLERLALEVGVAGRVHLIGAQADDEVARWYRACEVFVMPSLSEGFGIVFLEAMAFGKPVIGGAHGGTPEVVRDDVHGFLVPHGAVATLASRLICLLCNAQVRDRMARAGQHHVAGNYTFGHFRERLSRLLDS